MLCNINERYGALGHLLVAWALLMPSSIYIAYDRLLLGLLNLWPWGPNRAAQDEQSWPFGHFTSWGQVFCFSQEPCIHKTPLQMVLHCNFPTISCHTDLFPVINTFNTMGSSSQLSTKWQVSTLASLSVSAGAFPALEPAQIWQTFMSLSTPKYGICCLRIQKLCFCERCKVRYFVL